MCCRAGRQRRTAGTCGTVRSHAGHVCKPSGAAPKGGASGETQGDQMSNQSARQRGNDSANWAADYYRPRGFPHVEAVGAGRRGVDLLGMPGLAPEVKSSSEFRWDSWLTQAESRPGLPYVIYRPTRDRVGHGGLGVARLAEWPVLMRVKHHAALLLAAGYGDVASIEAQLAETDTELRDIIRGQVQA